MQILLNVVFLILGIFILVKSAELISYALVSLSKKTKLSEFFVGFVILSWISSIPEIAVVINSSTKIPALSVGNLLGAKVVLLGLLGGIMAVRFGGIKFKGRFNERFMLYALMMMAVMVLVTVDGVLSIFEGWLLIVLYFGYILILARQFKSFPEHFHIIHFKLENVFLINQKSIITFGKILLGAFGVLLASTIIVDSAVKIAEGLNISEAVIGLIVLALGTNLTEISILLTSSIKKVSERKLATGNIIGSAAINSMIFGLLIVIAGGIHMDFKDYISIIPSLVVLTLTLLAFVRFAWTGKSVSKIEGMMLVSLYISLIITELILIVSR
jgi:cation:H+ antiporter